MLKHLLHRTKFQIGTVHAWLRGPFDYAAIIGFQCDTFSLWIQENTDTLPVETNGDGSTAQSGVKNSEHHDETNPNEEHVTDENGGVKNDTSENNKKDNSTEEISIRRDDSVQQPKDKDSSTIKSSQAKDFLQDPLIMECDPSHRCIIENKKFIACLKVPGEGDPHPPSPLTHPPTLDV